MFWALLVVPSEATAPQIKYPDLDSLVLIEGNSLLALGMPISLSKSVSYKVLGVWVDIDNLLLRKLAFCESSLRSDAIGKAGEIGLFQFKKTTWQLYCQGDIWNAEDQIRCAQKIIEQGKGKIHWRNCWRKENLDKFLKTNQN